MDGHTAHLAFILSMPIKWAEDLNAVDRHTTGMVVAAADWRPQQISWVSAMLDRARIALQSTENVTIIHQAWPILAKLRTMLPSQSDRALSPAVLHSSSGAVVMEWVFPEKRFAIFFEPEPLDSGWFLVTSPRLGGLQEYGSLNDPRLDTMIRTLCD